jgi:hypothetical protein
LSVHVVHEPGTSVVKLWQQICARPLARELLASVMLLA